MKLRSFVVLVSALAGLTFALQVKAQTLLFDRGLPSAHLNTGDANQSNLFWYDSTINDNPIQLLGDTFNNPTANEWAISSIRVWTFTATDAIHVTSTSLYGGLAGATATLVSPSGSLTPTTYPGGINYMPTGPSGNTYTVLQVDFPVSIILQPGQTYAFYLDGTRDDSTHIPSISCSVASLSGTTQEGADGLLHEGYLSGSTIPWASTDYTSVEGAWQGGAQDANVQVFGEQIVPEPSTFALFALGGLLIRRFLRK